MRYFLNTLPDISIISTFLPLIFGYFTFPYLKKKVLPIFILINIACLTEIISLIVPYFGFNSNLICFNVYFILEITLTTLFYFIQLKKNRWGIVVAIGGSILLLLSIIQIIGSKKHQLNNVNLSIQSIEVILFSLLAFYHILQNIEFTNILAAPVFWINSAFLLYFGGNLFLHAFSNYLIKHELHSFFELWGIIHSLLNITFYILISIAFWKSRKFQA